MSTKVSPRSNKPRKHKHKEETRQEIVVQVHKTIKSATSSENDYGISEDNLESNKIYNKLEDKNENYSIHTPSREVSVDGETQINAKIISLIESEIKRDANRQSHFSDSRPQSLSFYEDEKMPEELSGNLELLSPEERRHYKKRKEYSQIDMDERNAYNVIQDLYSRDSEDIMNSKKSKSRKKRHIDSEIGMGDSREMMIPKEKKKSKKKKRENSPVNCSNAKRKHRRKDEDYEPRNDITVALEELQDDVFESNNDEFISKPEKMKKSPRRSDKLYVQRKNKFEPTTRAPGTTNHRSNPNFEESRKGLTSYMPLQIAIPFQGWWMRFSTLCHGLLSGLSLGHVLYIFCNNSTQDIEFLVHYAYYSDIYVGLFYALCVICIISVFDRVDIAHLDCAHFRDLFIFRKSSMAVIIYIACLLVHLSAARTDDKLSLVTYNNTTAYNISRNELSTWNHLSLWRAILSFLAWLLVGLGLPDDMLYLHLKNMEKYLPDK